MCLGKYTICRTIEKVTTYIASWNHCEEILTDYTGLACHKPRFGNPRWQRFLLASHSMPQQCHCCRAISVCVNDWKVIPAEVKMLSRDFQIWCPVWICITTTASRGVCILWHWSPPKNTNSYLFSSLLLTYLYLFSWCIRFSYIIFIKQNVLIKKIFLHPTSVIYYKPYVTMQNIHDML